MKIADIAQALGEPDYAVQTIADRFFLYIPATRIGDQLMYPEDSMDVFRLIFDQLRVGVRFSHIDVLLAHRYPVSEINVTGASRQMQDVYSGRDPQSFRDPAYGARSIDRRPESGELPYAQSSGSGHRIPPRGDDGPGVRDDIDALARRVAQLQERFDALITRIEKQSTEGMPMQAPFRTIREDVPRSPEPEAMPFEEMINRSRNRLGRSTGR